MRSEESLSLGLVLGAVALAGAAWVPRLLLDATPSLTLIVVAASLLAFGMVAAVPFEGPFARAALAAFPVVLLAGGSFAVLEEARHPARFPVAVVALVAYVTLVAAAIDAARRLKERAMDGST